MVYVFNSRLHVTPSSSSREAFAVYHKTNFIKSGTVRGATVFFEALVDEDTNELYLQGAVGEMKEVGRSELQEITDKQQLIANMEKVAGELALKAAKQEKLFSKIEMFSVLVDTAGKGFIGKLHLNFLERTANMCWSDQKLEFNDCISRILFQIS